MKEYCMKCGHGNDYSSVKPTKCSKCQTSLAAAVYKPYTKQLIQDKPWDNSIEDRIDSFDPEFSNTPLEMEPFTKEEIDSVVIASSANKSFNLRDILKQSPDAPAEAKKPIKRRKK